MIEMWKNELNAGRGQYLLHQAMEAGKSYTEPYQLIASKLKIYKGFKIYVEDPKEESYQKGKC